MDEYEKPDEVGYGNPPAKGRFVKGQSGNPAGRPPGALGLKAALRKVLADGTDGKSVAEEMLQRLIEVARSGDG
jgi:Family of unknown function (DUF5681)